jgi:hypothetical protein
MNHPDDFAPPEATHDQLDQFASRDTVEGTSLPLDLQTLTGDNVRRLVGDEMKEAPSIHTLAG